MMRRVYLTIAVALLLCALCVPVSSARLEGQVTSVTEREITAMFPAAVNDGSPMVVLTGHGENIAGVAISECCEGEGPYQVKGHITWISDVMNLSAGKLVYVNSIDARAIPSPKPKTPDNTEYYQPLGFYYYTTAQKIGYGALGLGLESFLDLGSGFILEADGGISGFNLTQASSDHVASNKQVFKSFAGKIRMNIEGENGLYAGYRYQQSQGSGDDNRWQQLADELDDQAFSGQSGIGSGKIKMSGIEYGLMFASGGDGVVSLGYIPSLETDYGGIGIRTTPGYTIELRSKGNKNGARLRGIACQDYWAIDLGISFR